MSEAELIEALRLYEERKNALAEAELHLHVGMAARLFRRGLLEERSRVGVLGLRAGVSGALGH